MLVRFSVIYKIYLCLLPADLHRQHCAAIFQKMCLAQGNLFYTGDRLIRSDNAAIRKHCFDNDHTFKISNFDIIDSTTQLLDLRILDPIHINTNRPEISKLLHLYIL